MLSKRVKIRMRYNKGRRSLPKWQRRRDYYADYIESYGSRMEEAQRVRKMNRITWSEYLAMTDDCRSFFSITK